jgi:hypothetical protein
VVWAFLFYTNGISLLFVPLTLILSSQGRKKGEGERDGRFEEKKKWRKY